MFTPEGEAPPRPMAGAASPLDALDAVCRVERDLDPELVVLLVRLARRYPHIFPSLKLLAEETHASESAVKRRLKRLTEFGLISTIRVGARAESRAYRVLHLPDLPVPHAYESSLRANLHRPMKAHDGGHESSPKASHEEQGEGQEKVSNTLVDETLEIVGQILGAFGRVDRDRIREAMQRYRLEHTQAIVIAQAVHRQGDLGSVLAAEDWFEMKASAATKHRVSV